MYSELVVRHAEFEIQMPKWLASLQTRHIPAQVIVAAEAAIEKPRTIPKQASSIPLTFVSVAEDLERKTPMIVFDYSFWEREGL